VDQGYFRQLTQRSTTVDLDEKPTPGQPPDQDEGEVFDPRNIRHMEGLLRAAGLSRTETKVLLARGFEACRTIR
jgi:hypothetical protein